MNINTMGIPLYGATLPAVVEGYPRLRKPGLSTYKKVVEGDAVCFFGHLLI
jgi:hypothetical protein